MADDVFSAPLPKPERFRVSRLWVFRLLAWGLALGPAIDLGVDVVTGDLGPNPVETLEHGTGLWALRLLLLTLAMTPLRRISGWNEAIQVRRVLGLAAFAYASLHLGLFVVLDLGLSLPALLSDLRDRRYITAGFAAWLLMLPLALTSTRGWQRRLKRRWKQLHRLVYVCAGLGALHFFWLVKSDYSRPWLYLGLMLLLLLARLPRPARKPLAS